MSYIRLRSDNYFPQVLAMENDKNWQYNTSLTVRLSKKLKDEIEQEAKARGISLSEYFRTFCESAELPGAFLDMLPEGHKAFIEKYVSQEESRTGKSRHEIITGLASQCVEYTLNNGFFIEFKRR